VSDPRLTRLAGAAAASALFALAAGPAAWIVTALAAAILAAVCAGDVERPQARRR
jgi:hypothetical protein